MPRVGQWRDSVEAADAPAIPTKPPAISTRTSIRVDFFSHRCPTALQRGPTIKTDTKALPAVVISPTEVVEELGEDGMVRRPLLAGRSARLLQHRDPQFADHHFSPRRPSIRSDAVSPIGTFIGSYTARASSRARASRCRESRARPDVQNVSFKRALSRWRDAPLGGVRGGTFRSDRRRVVDWRKHWERRNGWNGRYVRRWREFGRGR